jgi:hypothetical protein
MAMEVFLVWNGAKSRKMAEILKAWIPAVINDIKPWYSEDIEKGDRWVPVLEKKLKDCKAGIVCLTGENRKSPWLNFEAGALSNAIEKSYVCPYLLDIQKTDVEYPLAQFQLTLATEAETLLLMKTLNKALEENGLDDNLLTRSFEKWWPDLNSEIEKISSFEDQKEPLRTQEEVLQELLEGSREVLRLIRTGGHGEGIISHINPLASSAYPLNWKGIYNIPAWQLSNEDVEGMKYFLALGKLKETMSKMMEKENKDNIPPDNDPCSPRDKEH